MNERNIWMRSLLIGLTVAAGVFVVFDKIKSRRVSKKYSLVYTIKATTGNDSGHKSPVPKVIQVLGKRLEMAGYRHEIKTIDEKIIRVSLFDMEDTTTARSILTSRGSVEFRELYNMNEVTPCLLAAIVVAGGSPPLPDDATPAENTTTKKALSELYSNDELNKKEEEKEPAREELIEFDNPYTNVTGELQYPAAIGTIKLKDTGTVRQLFQADTVRRLTPADAELCFGEPVNSYTNEKEKEQKITFYFLKKITGLRIVLGNEDIREAVQDFDAKGRVEVRLEFNKTGTRKWATMTRQNIGRCIAIVVNGVVRSAPNVSGSIEDGVSSISGSYSIQDALALAIGLKSNKLPVPVSIISSYTKHVIPPGEIGKKSLVALVGFVVSAGLAFFMFKTLKST